MEIPSVAHPQSAKLSDKIPKNPEKSRKMDKEEDAPPDALGKWRKMAKNLKKFPKKMGGGAGF